MERTKALKQAALAVGLMSVMGFAIDVSAESGKSSDESPPSAFGRTGNQGQGFGEDQTIKGSGKLPESTPQEDAQVTLGGARPYVIGEVLQVNGGDYTIRDQSGSEVRIRVNKDTRMECATEKCAFKQGDQVKAEMSDEGTALSLKQISGKR